MQKKSSFLRHNGVALLLTAGLFALVFVIVFRFRLYTGNFTTDYETAYLSDYLSHAIWAMGMTQEAVLSSFYDGSERLWHVFVKLLFSCGVKNIWAAAAAVTAAADAAAYFLVYKSLETAVSKKFPRWLLAALTVSVFVVNALTLPGFSSYIGRGAINTWHNPTNIMVRPFAAAVFYMTIRIYNRRRYGIHTALVPPAEAARCFAFDGRFGSQFRRPVYTKSELVLYPLCLLLSTYAKPSFLQFFAPAILIFLLIDVVRTKGMLLPFCIKLALAYIPAAIILFSQFFSFFGSAGLVSAAAVETTEAATGAGSGIALYFIDPSFSGADDFLKALGQALLGILYLCAFPLFILAVDGRSALRDTSYRLGLTGMVVARLESLFLHETGSRSAHGNFLWGYYLSVWMLWCAALGRYILLVSKESTGGKLTRWGGSALLLWHLTAGAVYVIRILQTGKYYL